MRRRRFLAPWHREVVEFSEVDGEEGALREFLAGLRGKPAIYHCVSRVVNREFVLKREEREKFVALMRVYERFCQVRVLTFCVMSNHFHILLEVPAVPDDGGASWTDEELLDHMSCLYSERQMGELRWELEHYRAGKMDGAAEAFRERFFVRMWDLSAFMKVLKQRFTQWFNKKHEREGDRQKGRRGISKEKVAQILAEGGELSEGMMAWCTARHMSDGLALGTELFLNGIFALSREYFGAARRSGARKIRQVRTALRTMRNLQRDTLSV